MFLQLDGRLVLCEKADFIAKLEIEENFAYFLFLPRLSVLHAVVMEKKYRRLSDLLWSFGF